MGRLDIRARNVKIYGLPARERGAEASVKPENPRPDAGFCPLRPDMARGMVKKIVENFFTVTKKAGDSPGFLGRWPSEGYLRLPSRSRSQSGTATGRPCRFTRACWVLPEASRRVLSSFHISYTKRRDARPHSLMAVCTCTRSS